jgi:hypothetical protein
MSNLVILHPNVRDKIGQELLPSYQQTIAERESLLAAHSPIDGGRQSSDFFREESFGATVRAAAFIDWLSKGQSSCELFSYSLKSTIMQIQHDLTRLLPYQRRSLGPQFGKIQAKLEHTQRELSGVLDNFSQFSCGVRYKLPHTLPEALHADAQSQRSSSEVGVGDKLVGKRVQEYLATWSINSIEIHVKNLIPTTLKLMRFLDSMVQFYEAEKHEYADPRFHATQSLQKRHEARLETARQLSKHLESVHTDLESFSKSVGRINTSPPFSRRLLKGFSTALHWISDNLF